MTTYNAKDLIEQAQMLADLQNSDFISWKENIMFLDNAWADLYQQIINHGDKSFLQYFTFNGNSCILPDDFYQLYYICYNDGCFKRPINRIAKTSTNEGPYYDIVGNELIIYNKINSLKNIEVSYFPVRESITYAAEERNIEPIEGRIIDVCNSKVYYLASDGGGYKIKDVITGNETDSYLGQMLTDSGVSSNSYNKRLLIKSNNKLYLTLDEVSTSIGIYKASASHAKIGDVIVPENINVDYVNGFTNEGLYYIFNDHIMFSPFESDTYTELESVGDNKNIYCFSNYVFYETEKGICCNQELLVPITEYSTFNGVMKVDEKTGYGILVDNSRIISAFKNTELDFPNNVYYNYLAYKLAAYYKIKQGADPSGIVALGSDALETFYNTLPRDDNEYVRIANAYAR